MNVPDLLSKLVLLVVELGPGDSLLVRLLLPLRLDYNGLPAGHGQLHVADHLLLLFQQLAVLNLGTWLN